jgi:hypothetical protein
MKPHKAVSCSVHTCPATVHAPRQVQSSGAGSPAACRHNTQKQEAPLMSCSVAHVQAHLVWSDQAGQAAQQLVINHGSQPCIPAARCNVQQPRATRITSLQRQQHAHRDALYTDWVTCSSPVPLASPACSSSTHTRRDALYTDWVTCSSPVPLASPACSGTHTWHENK